MHNLFAFLAAILLTGITISSACSATPPTMLSFTLEQSANSDRIQAKFSKDNGRNNNWSSDFAAAELSGLDVARLRAPGTAPLRFALVREAGRIDCAGTGGNAQARGTCRATPDTAFLSLLERRGIGRPTGEQAFGLIALDVRRDLIQSLAAANYPTPQIDDLMSLAALGVTSRYIGELSRVGYRPASLDALVQFKALAITPEYIQGFVRLGYGDLAADQLVQLKALNITADYVAGFERIGYGRLPAGDLVQLKALGVTPDYVAGFRRLGYGLLPPGKLIEMKALGVTPQFVRSLQSEGMALPSPDQLVKLRAIRW